MGFTSAQGRLRDRMRQRAVGFWGAATMLCVLLHADVIDRVVAVVGQQAITASEVELQLRLEAMFNREVLDLSAEKRGQALERLIAVRLIQSEALAAGFLSASEEDVQRRLEVSQKERYLNNLEFGQALQSYDLREQDVIEFWEQVISYERFKDFRFKTGLDVSSAEVSAYYQRHIVPEFRAQGNSPPPLEEISASVEQAVIEERANTLVEEWLKEVRAQTRIVILDQEPQAAKKGLTPAAPATEKSGAAPR
jgi:hypothetical protein